MEIHAIGTPATSGKTYSGVANNHRIGPREHQDSISQQSRISQILDSAIPLTDICHLVQEKKQRARFRPHRLNKFAEQANKGMVVVDHFAGQIGNSPGKYAGLQQIGHVLLQESRFSHLSPSGDGIDTGGFAGQTLSGSYGWTARSGKLVIDGDVTSRNGDFGSVGRTAALDITGSFTSGGGGQFMGGTVTLSGTGRWNLQSNGIFELTDGGDADTTLNIQDNAVLDVDRTAGSPTGIWSPGDLVLSMGWRSANPLHVAEATVNQDGGTVNVTRPVTAMKATGFDGGPGLIMAGVVSEVGKSAVEATYNLNGGTLNASGIYNLSGLWTGPVIDDPAVYSETAIFNFNGGLLKASQDDSTDAQVIAEGFNHFMGNLTHAYVKGGGATIDTNTFNASIDQALEHDPALGDAPDGGL